MTETAIVVPVRDAEAIIGEWTRRHTPSGADGTPADVRLLVPFTALEELTSERLARVGAVLERFAPVDLVLARCAYFDGARWRVTHEVPSDGSRSAVSVCARK